MKRTLLGIAMIVCLQMEGCSGISNPDQIVFPADSVSYAGQVEPYFTLACNATGCHNDIDQADGVNLSSWTQIRGTPGLVDVNTANPNLDTSSTLLLVMSGDIQHTPPLTANQNQRDGIRQWVMEGAKNN